MPAVNDILVINVSRIGDTLLVTPVLRALNQAWPQARIRFLGHPKRVEVMEHLPYLSATGSITKHSARLRGWLPRARYDLALVYGFDRALVAYALRVAKDVVAFRQKDAALDRRLHRCVEPPPFQTMHAASIPLLLTSALGVPGAGMRLAYQVTDQEKQWARARLPQAAWPLVGFQVASFATKSYRDWPLERFAALAERIFARWKDAHLFLFGGAPDRVRTQALAARYADRATDFAGRISLRETAALMSELNLYVGVDTGPTHIMGALEPPMIALYHCYSPSRLLAPLGRERCYVIDHPRTQGCSPETPMSEISVDAVWAKALEALSPA